MSNYKGTRLPPLTPKEIEGRYEEALEELEEVKKWKKEEDKRLKSKSATPQAKGAAKRALLKVKKIGYCWRKYFILEIEKRR